MSFAPMPPALRLSAERLLLHDPQHFCRLRVDAAGAFLLQHAPDQQREFGILA